MICLVIGLVVAVLRLDEILAAAVLFGSLGLVFVIGGAIAFASYLRDAPPPEQA